MSIKDSKEKVRQPRTRREITRKLKVNLPTMNKRVAETIINKADRRHYINMCLDAIITEREMKMRKQQPREAASE